MGINGHFLEMLFIDPKFRGQGLGKQLLQLGQTKYGVNELSVNEQNPQAVGFYQHMGFETYKRTDLDEEGQPYPLLYMKTGEASGN
jgi:putative acetyltransferase